MTKLNTNKTYLFKRVGDDTQFCKEGRTYLFKYEEGRWTTHDKDGCVLYHCMERTLWNTEFWQYEGEFKSNQTKKETNMSFDKVSKEALEIRTNAVLINGQDAATFSDDAIIKMMAAERKKILTLETDADGANKYIEAKKTKMQENLAALAAILESRV